MEKRPKELDLHYIVEGTLTFDDGSEMKVSGTVVQFNEHGAPVCLSLHGVGLMGIEPPQQTRHDFLGLMRSINAHSAFAADDGSSSDPLRGWLDELFAKAPDPSKEDDHGA